MMIMKKTYLYLMLLGALLSMSSCVKEEPAQPNVTPEEEQPTTYLEGELIVKFSADAAAVIEQQCQTRSAVTRSGIGSVDEVLSLINGYELERVFPYVADTEQRTRHRSIFFTS